MTVDMTKRERKVIMRSCENGSKQKIFGSSVFWTTSSGKKVQMICYATGGVGVIIRGSSDQSFEGPRAEETYWRIREIALKKMME